MTWWSRPTVVVDGRGQPAQWGTGTWAVPAEGGAAIAVYLYNRAWRHGAARLPVPAAAAGTDVVEYRVGALPWSRGRLVASAR